MTLFRALRPLSDGTQRGGVTPLAKLTPTEVEKLRGLGVIAPVSAPPLVIFPSWKARAEKLGAVAITDAAQLIESKTTELAAALKEEPAEIERWKAEARALLIAPKG